MSKPTAHHRLARIKRFFADGLWDVELTSLSALPRLGVKCLRVIQLVFQGFIDDDCPLHAGALTFSSLLAIVPILALSLALTRGLGDTGTAKARIRSLATEWTQGISIPAAAAVEGGEADAIIPGATNAGPCEGMDLSEEAGLLADRAFEKVENVSFKALGGVGLVLLIIAVVQVLGQVELSFNRVWGVTVGRTLWRRFSDYLSVLLVLPVLIIAASSLPIVDMATRFTDQSLTGAVGALLHAGWVKPLTVVIMTSASIAFLIMFMPNTRVRLGPGVMGGLVAGGLFLMWIWLCKQLQLGVAGYSRIYGSFAFVPIILLWVFVSWEIVLLGAEVAFAIQNVTTYRMERRTRDASAQARLVLLVSVVAEAARLAQDGEGPFSAAAFARERCIPVRFLNETVEALTQAGLLAELAGESGSYVLMKAPSTLTVREVFDRIMTAGVLPEDLGLRALDPVTQQMLKRLEAGVDKSVGYLTVEQLRGQTGAQG